MRSGGIALCVDRLTCQNPELIGLEGEALDAQSWLSVYVNGEEARSAVAGQDGIAEAWVASCEDVDPINLAATLKADNPELPVRLVASERCGSLCSRAYTASIDEVLDLRAFLDLYNDAKARHAEGHAIGESGRLAGVQAASAGGETVALESQAPVLELRNATAPLAPTVLEQPAIAVLERPALAVAMRKRGFVMPVVSGSGGAGKSSVSVVAAFAARDMGYRTLLLDYDLQFGDVAAMAGVEEPLAIDEAIAHPDRLERELVRNAPLTVIAAPDRLEKAEGVVANMPVFLDRVAPEFDVVIANTGAAWAEQHAVLLERSYTSLFLVDQRASSLRACKHALELCARCGIATGPFEFALNRCAKGMPLTPADVSCALQGATVYELKDGGRDVEDYLASGSVEDLLQMGNEFCISVRQVMGRLLPTAGATASPGDRLSGDGLLSKRRGRHVGRRKGKRS